MYGDHGSFGVHVGLSNGDTAKRLQLNLPGGFAIKCTTKHPCDVVKPHHDVVERKLKQQAAFALELISHRQVVQDLLLREHVELAAVEEDRDVWIRVFRIDPDDASAANLAHDLERRLGQPSGLEVLKEFALKERLECLVFCVAGNACRDAGDGLTPLAFRRSGRTGTAPA